MTNVYPEVEAMKFNERVNTRLAGLKSEGLVIYATATFGSGSEMSHGIHVIVTNDSTELQIRIQDCLGSLGRPIIISKRVNTFEAVKSDEPKTSEGSVV